MPPIFKNGILKFPAYRKFENIFYILDEPLDDLKWNLLCLSIDGNNYLRFNLNGETLLAQKIQNSSRKYFSEVSTITFGSETVSGLLSVILQRSKFNKNPFIDVKQRVSGCKY